MSEQSLTLLGIETALLELIQYREDLYSNPDVSDEERPELLNAADQRVKEFVLREVKKADGLAYNLTEFRRRVGKCSGRDWKEPGAIDLEIERLKKLKASWLARHDYLEAVTITALQFIEQTEGRKRIEGECSTLTLRDNPPKVEVTQEALVPCEFERITLTMPVSWFQEIQRLNYEHDVSLFERLLELSKTAKIDYMKAEIARVLKSTEKCDKCGGSGKVLAGFGQPGLGEVDCDLCKGAKVVPRGVPGARLVSGVRLEVK